MSPRFASHVSPLSISLSLATHRNARLLAASVTTTTTKTSSSTITSSSAAYLHHLVAHRTCTSPTSSRCSPLPRPSLSRRFPPPPASLLPSYRPSSSSSSSHHAPTTMAPAPAAAAPRTRGLILTLSCTDQVGIVSSVTSWLASRGLNIRDSAQFGDADTRRFFMRVCADEIPTSESTTTTTTATAAAAGGGAARQDDEEEGGWIKETAEAFGEQMGKKFGMEFQVHSKYYRPRTLIMVSKIGHCLNDLLFRLKAGTLPIQVPLIVSNHEEYRDLASQHNIPFFHLPISAAEGKTKEWQEDQIMRLMREHRIELVVLARYMQILSPKLCADMSGRIINIHHSFLPSFKGAKPYHQAYERGVKLIGATAHIVTSDLDEGPIIEQSVERVTHAFSPNDLVQAGSDVEARVLARAVKWYAERRVLQNGAKTVVFA